MPADDVTTILTAFQQQQLAALQRNLTRDNDLLTEYEELISYEDDPRRRRRYEKEVERQRKAIANHVRELNSIMPHLPQSTTPADTLADQIQQTVNTIQTTVNLAQRDAVQLAQIIQMLSDLARR